LPSDDREGPTFLAEERAAAAAVNLRPDHLPNPVRLALAAAAWRPQLVTDSGRAESLKRVECRVDDDVSIEGRGVLGMGEPTRELPRVAGDRLQVGADTL
jgi:hypothetical protein